MRPAGGNHVTLRKYADKVWHIPTDHFDADAARHVVGGSRACPLDEVLIEHSRYSRRTLKARLYREGLKERRCELCGQGEEWYGRRMALILDHINGVADDNRLENLRIVCANCNATLETHCARNLSRGPEAHRGLPRRDCLRCSASFEARYRQQRYCSRECGQRHHRSGHNDPGARRVERPPYAQLLSEGATLGWSATGRKYGVSDNAIRKWVRAYEAATSVAADAPESGECAPREIAA